MKTTYSCVCAGLLAMQLTCGAQAASTSPSSPLWMQMQAAVLRKKDSSEVQRILKAGFDVNSPIGCGTFSALDGAVQIQNVEVVRILLQAGARAKGSALLSAAGCQNSDASLAMVEALLKAGADPNYKEDFPNPDCHSPIPLSMALHKTCCQGHLEVVKLLLSQPEVELNTLDIDGYTPLMCAVERGHEKIIRLLLGNGADPEIKNSEGKTASDIAREQIRKREEILKMLSDDETATEQSAPANRASPRR